MHTRLLSHQMRVPESMSETEYLMALDQLAPTAPDKLRHHLFNQAITMATREGAMEEARGLLAPVTDLACIRTHMYTHWHMHACVHTLTHTHIHTQAHVCTLMRVHTHTHTHRHTHTGTCVYTNASTHTHTQAHVCTLMRVHTHTHRHTHTGTHRHMCVH